jgi:hypothetical protein
MEKKTRKKWIIGVLLAVLIAFGSFITYEVISFNRDMRILGQSLGELSEGLMELGEGLSKLGFSTDTASVASDSLNLEAPVEEPLGTLPDGQN